MDITRKGREDLEGYKDTMDEARLFHQDRMDAEMFIAWQKNNPNEYRKWQESGCPLDGNDKPIITSSSTSSTINEEGNVRGES